MSKNYFWVLTRTTFKLSFIFYEIKLATLIQLVLHFSCFETTFKYEMLRCTKHSRTVKRVLNRKTSQEMSSRGLGVGELA